MRRFLNILLTGISLIALSACVNGLSIDSPSSDDAIKVVGRITHFQNHDATKSLKNGKESKIKNMALLIFDSAGEKVFYELIDGGQPLFLIDRSKAPFNNHDQDLLIKCKLYILANVPAANQSELSTVTTESGMLDLNFNTSSVLRENGIDSYGGIPMIGMIDKVENDPDRHIDLRVKETSTLTSSVLEIPLTCLMAKVKFNIVVNPVQISDFTQRFELKSWVVENAPTKVSLRQPTGTNESKHSDGPFISTATFSTIDNGSNTVMQGNTTPMSFWCYVPEQRVNPTGSSPYPESISDDNPYRQNYKPGWLTDADHPIKITLNGIYTDHRGIEKAVTYTVYPGANNYDDFYINRNGEYINNITIKGISNSIHGDEGTISVDWRVDVKQNDFKFELERETLLDSHWEIRPIRITLDPSAHPNAHHIEVEIMNADSTPWIRMEMPSAKQITDNPSLYCDAVSGQLAYGKRRYFTTGLVTSDLAGGTKCSFGANDTNNSGIPNEHVIWVYIDENVSGAPASGSNTRQAKVQCRYYEKKASDSSEANPTPTVTDDYFFRQRSLHNITQNEHTYGIEYYEEYLYNFDSRDDFTTLPDGMVWGLYNKQLSNQHQSFIYPTSGWGIISGIIEYAISSCKLYYDFYLERDETQNGVVVHSLAGKEFTSEIVTTASIGALATNVSPSSAVEYCYNKNKRNSSGVVEDIKWYLPAIDEIEEIVVGGYSEFEVFQNKYYWSSQPASKNNYLYYLGKALGSNGEYSYFSDDIGLDNSTETSLSIQDDPNDKYGRARATKVNVVNGEYKSANSESHKYSGARVLYSELTWNGNEITTNKYFNCFEDHPAKYKESINGGNILTGFWTLGPNFSFDWSPALFDEGAQPRETINRVRCAYKP